MRVLMASAAPYGAFGGAQKANRILAESLARRYEVSVVGLARPRNRDGGVPDFRTDMKARGIESTPGDGFDRFRLAGVDVVAGHDALHLGDTLASEIRAWCPDVVMISSEDWRQSLLHAVFGETGFAGPVVYQCRTLTSVPFGPWSADRSKEGTALVQRCASVTPCTFYAEYMREHADIEASVIYNDFREQTGAPVLASFDNPYVMMVNPCPIKGLAIFAGLARAFPETRFAAVPSWGTTPADRTLLEEIANVELLSAVEDVDTLFARTKVLLAPSIWPEGIANIVVEAMLRGIPVIASDHGGLPEAMQGAGIALPIRPISSFTSRRGLPVAKEIPEQDVGPWQAALGALLADRGAYEESSAKARVASERFAASTGSEPYERLFEELVGRGG